ncbi:hypothetical protein VPH35_131877 [Triticum aestivum]
MGSVSNYLPLIGMILVQLGLAGLNVLSKLTMASGMSPYRNDEPGVLLHGSQVQPPDRGVRANNTLSAVTFALAAALKMEPVAALDGKAKVAGTALCMVGSITSRKGAMVQGPLVKTLDSPVHWPYVQRTMAAEAAAHAGGHAAALGAALVIASNVAWAVWFIIQDVQHLLVSVHTTTVLMAAMASVQSGVIAVAAEHRLSAWALGFDIRLVGSLYAGVVASGIVIAVMSWCIQVRGPVFVSMFSPMMLIIVAVVGWGILGENIRVGSVIGAVFVVVGLYTVLWGKGRDIVATETVEDDEEKKIGGGEPGNGAVDGVAALRPCPA